MEIALVTEHVYQAHYSALAVEWGDPGAHSIDSVDYPDFGDKLRGRPPPGPCCQAVASVTKETMAA
jgi:hypothetical protein